jgi:hypothetical protein
MSVVGRLLCACSILAFDGAVPRPGTLEVSDVAPGLGHGHRGRPECFLLQVGASTLARVLHRLRHDVHASPGVLSGLDSADDAAVLAAPPPGHVSVQVPNPAINMTAGLTSSGTSPSTLTLATLSGPGRNTNQQALPASVHTGTHTRELNDVDTNSLVISIRNSVCFEARASAVQTVDFFRASLSDPYVFGRVAAQHALGDCHAMGAAPTSALAIAVVPFAADAQASLPAHQRPLQPRLDPQAFRRLEHHDRRPMVGKPSRGR